MPFLGMNFSGFVLVFIKNKFACSETLEFSSLLEPNQTELVRAELEKTSKY
jgi:hypothetical protein